MSINVNNNLYKLAGLIVHNRYKNNPMDGHYVAFTWQNEWFNYDDLSTHRKLVKEDYEVSPRILLYVL